MANFDKQKAIDYIKDYARQDKMLTGYKVKDDGHIIIGIDKNRAENGYNNYKKSGFDKGGKSDIFTYWGYGDKFKQSLMRILGASKVSVVLH